MIAIRPVPVAVALAGVLGIGLMVYGLTDERAASGMMPTSAEATGQVASLDAVGPARIEPISGEIELSTSTAGVLASISVQEGESVVKGQVLAVLDNADSIARVAQAQATLQMQQSKLERLLSGFSSEEMKQAKAAIDEQDAALLSQTREVARQRSLQARGYSSASLLEQAQSAEAVSLARKRAKAEALAQMVAGPRREDVNGANAEVQLARAQLNEAAAALDKTVIRSPIDGVVLRIYKHVGESVGLVGSTSTIMQVGDVSQLVARAQIDDADMGRISVGSRAYVTTSAFPGRRFPGHVSALSPRVGAKTIQTGAPTEKRDASVLDIIVALDPGTSLPVGLRVDCYVLGRRAEP